MACGFTRNQILLPLAAEDWSPETMKQVLAHEQAHGTRFDIAWDLLGPLVVAVCWIQPFAWIALRELRREREWACDDLVLDLGLDRIEYAQTISEFAATSSLQPAMAGSGRGNLEERMKHLLNINAPRRKVTLLSAILATLGSVAMASTLPMLSLAQDKETKPYDKPPRVSYKVEPQYTEGAREVDVPATIEVNFKLK